jgi:hypothetical protein
MAAELFAELGDSKLAVDECEIAAAEREAYADELDRQPEWAGGIGGRSDAQAGMRGPLFPSSTPSSDSRSGGGSRALAGAAPVRKIARTRLPKLINDDRPARSP